VELPIMETPPPAANVDPHKYTGYGKADTEGFKAKNPDFFKND
jgi:hypothetical protein